MQQTLQQHWEKVYLTKAPHEVSWTEERPAASLELIESLHLESGSRIADIGGGDSKLADCLLETGYWDLTVVDIAPAALERAKHRLGSAANRVKWVVSDVLQLQPEAPFDLWHDRATFHFLTQPAQVGQYLSLLRQYARRYVLLACFSTEGPNACSGLPVKQYNRQSLTRLLQQDFEPVCFRDVIHTTPAGAKQAFVYGLFERKA